MAEFVDLRFLVAGSYHTVIYVGVRCQTLASFGFRRNLSVRRGAIFFSSVRRGAIFVPVCTLLGISRSSLEGQPTSSSSCGHFHQRNLPYFIVFFRYLMCDANCSDGEFRISYISAKLHCYKLSLGITCNSYTYVPVRNLGMSTQHTNMLSI